MSRRKETIELLSQLLVIAKDETIVDFDHLRLGQMLLNVTKKESILYNIESPELMEKMKSYLKQNVQK